jgi:hypothetical protein
LSSIFGLETVCNVRKRSSEAAPQTGEAYPAV